MTPDELTRAGNHRYRSVNTCSLCKHLEVPPFVPSTASTLDQRCRCGLGDFPIDQVTGQTCDRYQSVREGER